MLPQLIHFEYPQYIMQAYTTGIKTSTYQSVIASQKMVLKQHV
jgi:hypothetical protein